MKISDCLAFSPFKTLPGCRAFRRSVLAGIAPCTVSPQNKRHQDQTKLGFYSSLYNWKQLNCIKPQRFLKCTSTILCLTFPWNLRSRIRARYHSDLSSSRSSTDEDCRAVLLFIPYRPRVIHALSWAARRLHYEWHSARYKHSCMLTWFHWPPNKLLSGALISSCLPQALCIF